MFFISDQKATAYQCCILRNISNLLDFENWEIVDGLAAQDHLEKQNLLYGVSQKPSPDKYPKKLFGIFQFFTLFLPGLRVLEVLEYWMDAVALRSILQQQKL